MSTPKANHVDEKVLMTVYGYKMFALFLASSNKFSHSVVLIIIWSRKYFISILKASGWSLIKHSRVGDSRSSTAWSFFGCLKERAAALKCWSQTVIILLSKVELEELSSDKQSWAVLSRDGEKKWNKAGDRKTPATVLSVSIWEEEHFKVPGSHCWQQHSVCLTTGVRIEFKHSHLKLVVCGKNTLQRFIHLFYNV